MISFDNTEIAFRSKSNKDLRRAFWLFKIIGSPTIVKIGKAVTNFFLAIRFPMAWAIKPTIFKQFCGGETIPECDKTINTLGSFNVGTILDYSVEGKINDEDFNQTVEVILDTIKRAKKDKNIPFAVFKVSGIGRFDLLEKASNKNHQLSEKENKELAVINSRIGKICQAAHDCQVSVFIDAEESWIQDIIDRWANEQMIKFNYSLPIVYNTLQMYRHDRMNYLREMLLFAKENKIIYAAKIVRGAYMEKERARAATKAYPSPIQVDKNATDRDYDEALNFMVSNKSHFALCAGTHNEESSLKLSQLLKKNGIPANDTRFYFSQLLGMSDHISYNLANAGYNVAKYVPFGPIREVMPYLLRRADENTSVAGQTGRELSLITKERKRRKMLAGKIITQNNKND
ncbi:MAG: proline dehydrogenase family protein [Bacteroidetes bacterium]|nr:proline dehydrogenase family protein [Bacteroidota bacterium]